MKLTIGKKLTISFLGLAGLVLLAGIVGIFILNQVSSSADMVAKEKAPVQNSVMNGVLALEVVQKTISEYMHTSSGLQDLEKKMISKLDEYDMWASMLKHGTDSEEFKKSKSGKLFEELKINISVPKGSEKIQVVLNKVLKQSVVFKKNLNDLIAAHKDYLSYSVTIDDKNYPLPVFLNIANKEHDEWVISLNDAVTVVTLFKGNMDSAKGMMGQWLTKYNVDNEKLMKLVKKMQKRHKKMMKAVVAINADKTYEGKLKLFNRNGASVALISSYFVAMHALVAPIYDDLENSQKEKLKAMTLSAEKINKDFDSLRINAGLEMASALEQAEKTKTKGITFLMILTLVAVIIAIVLGIIMSRYLSGKINSIADITKKVSNGDLKNKIKVTSKDELGDLANDTNAMIDNLREMIGKVLSFSQQLSDSSKGLSDLSGNMSEDAGEMSEGSESVAAAAEEMSSNMNSVAAACEEAAANVNMVSASTEEINSSINEIAQNSEQSRLVTGDAVSKSGNASERVDELGQAAKEISRVTEVISDISEQTNLLALNATIEAARAGEAGKGFAVVASEIKELARQTADATKGIKERVDTIQNSTSETVVEIQSVSKVIGDVSDIVGTIAAAVEEQSVTTGGISENMNQASIGLQEVNENVSQSSAVAGEIAKDIGNINNASTKIQQGSEQVKTNAEGLADLAGDLQTLVNKFQL
ncbi:MAG: methyl-accepting chemotaxis protein [Desulfobacteraceae bacterium]|nr:methyl-accepting chemotaxis protein [Desulfobacteraceae bacterium]